MSTVYPPKDRYGSKAEEMKKIGAYVVRSDEAERRLNQIKTQIAEKMQEAIEGNTPQEQMKNLAKKWNEIVGTIRHVGIPFLQGGSDAGYGKLVFLFETLDGMAQTFLSVMSEMVRSYEEAEEENAKRLNIPNPRFSTSWDTVRKSIVFMDVEFFPWVLSIVGISWKKEYLTEKEVIAIQTPMIQTRDVTGLDRVPKPGEEDY